ncbi:MAG: flagellar motor switch protein FliN [Buchnera aphidicola (Schlechtendalia peitan)]
MNNKDIAVENTHNKNTNKLDATENLKKAINIDSNEVNVEKSIQKHDNMNVVIDIPINVTVELGKIILKIKDLLNLSKDSILTLDKYSGEPLNILVNKRVIARGELVVVEDKYGIRITEIINNSENLSNLS